MQKSEATLFTKGYTLTCWWKHCYYDGRMSSSDNERIFLGNEILRIIYPNKLFFFCTNKTGMETDKVDDEKAMEEVGRDIYEVCHILGLFEKTMSYFHLVLFRCCCC